MGKNNKQSKTNLDYALAYIARGWHIFPIFYRRDDGTCSCGSSKCKRISKHPLPRNGFLAATTDEAQIRAWWTQDPNYNIGFCPSMSGLVGIDIDCGIHKKTGEPKVGRKTWDALLAGSNHKLPAALSVLTGGGGEHIYLKTNGDIQKSEGRVGKDIDVRGAGGYLILPPSTHETGKCYTFRDGDRWPEAAYEMGNLPEWLANLMDKPAAPSPVTVRAASPTPNPDESDLPPDDAHDKLTLLQLQELLKVIPASPRDNWLTMGGVLKKIAGWFESGKTFEVWDAWAQTGEGYGGLEDQKKSWESFGPTRVPPIALLRKRARENGWTPSDEFQKQDRTLWKGVAQQMMDALPDDAESDSDTVTALFGVLSRLPELVRDDFLGKIRKRFKSWRVTVMRNQVAQHQKQRASDDGTETDYAMMVARQVLAEHFADGKHLLRTSDRSFWRYNGRYWEQVANEEEIGNLCLEGTRTLGAIRKDVDTVTQQAINILRKQQARSGDPLRLSQPPLSIINCKNGELWLQEDGSVKVQEHSPDSFLRFCLDIEYDPTADCPLFDAALLAIFQKSPDPADMRRHLHEVFGYAIQPERYIKQFWLWEGDGDNGKTALVDTLCLLVGAQSFFPADIRKIGHEYYLSHLKTKLLLRDDDVSWNTVLPDGPLKQLSEGKVILGRDPHGKPKEFTSCVLPIMLCNKYPITKDLSRGVLTRVHVIPFRHYFVETMPDGSPGDMDRALFKRIWKSELPGILNRSIEGLQRLRKRGGYQEPEDCLRAKQEFLRKANPLPRFISEACTTLEQLRHQARLAELRKHFNNADELMSVNHFGEGMEFIDSVLAIAMAKAEKEGLRQPLTELYQHFWAWTRNEGIQMAHKPTRADVENYLINLGYAIGDVDHQKWVEGVRAFPQKDERPPDAM